MFGVVNRKVVVFVSAEAWNREQDHVKSIVMAVKESQIGLVLPAQGLIVGCYQILEALEELLLMDGMVRVTANTALIVFNPQQGVIMSGVVTEIGPESLRLTNGFFNHIYVPSTEWGRLKLSKSADGSDSLIDVDKPLFSVIKGDRVRVRVISSISTAQGLHVTCSIAGEFLGALFWFHANARRLD